MTFVIFQNGGEIKAKISLDRETTPSYTLDIRAKDRGSPCLNSTVKVTIAVLDKNDNEPRYNVDYRFEVKEDVSLNARVGEVTASDADEGSSGKVVYAIIGGNVKSS